MTAADERSNRLNRKERDRRLRASDILRTAERLFAEKGYHRTTMQMIAREAEYAVGTIYLYFPDKQSLYLTLIEKKLADLIDTVQEKVKRVPEAEGKIRVLIEEELRYFEENQDFFRIYFSERDGLNWTIKNKISRLAVNRMMEYLDYIDGLVRQAQKEGYVRKELDAKRVAFLLASLIKSAVFPWLQKPDSGKDDFRELPGFVLEVFYRGVGTR